jgi:hypothetical protein
MRSFAVTIGWSGLLGLALIMTGCKAPQDGQAPPAAAPYEQVGPTQDTSFGKIRRVSMRITIPDGHSRAEISAALSKAAEELAIRERADATMVFAYRPGDDTTGVYTVGRAIYAPDGRWENAGQEGAKRAVVDLAIGPDEGRADSNSGGGAPAGAPVNKITSNRFEIRVHRDGHTLSIALDTDLPDETDVMVGVARSYKAAVDGKPDEYVESYLDEKSTVAAWRRPKTVDVSDFIFRNALRETRDRVAKAGIQHSTGRISRDVTVSFVVPVNQTDPRFGKGNSNLDGPVVQKEGSWKIIRKEAAVRMPLGANSL